MGHQTWRVTAIGIFFWMIILMSGCGVVQHMEAKEDANAPKDGLLQSEKIQTKPGLSVVYTSNKIRHINEMPGSDWMIKNGSHGEPIPMIAHQFGSGEVFDSEKKREVCVQMQGYLGFNETGSYLIKANSNDGVRVFLDNKMILDDPDVHSDRFTPEVKIEIDKPGRYPILVRYFQRKGSATLEMHWKTPGSDTFDFIPASAYSHDNNAP